MTKITMRGIYAAVAFLFFATAGHASQCLTVPPGAGCSVPGSENSCTFSPSVGTMTDCAAVCPNGDAGCYYQSPADVGTSCSPAISCFSTQTCNCLPGASCSSDSNCIGQNQMCDVNAHVCVPKQASRAFIKHGNNGTVSCNTFCAGPQWGQVGTCTGTAISSLACGLHEGIRAGPEQTCVCRDYLGNPFVKHGNDGTVSCDVFCAGPQWGPVGSCASASVAQNSNCNVLPGFINAEMTCYCNSY